MGLINCGKLQREPSVILNAKGGYRWGVAYIYLAAVIQTKGLFVQVA